MFQVADAVQASLRYAGVVTPYDVDADSPQFDIALEHMNMLLAEKLGTSTNWWWVPAEQEIPVDAGVSSYTLDNELSSAEPLLMAFDAFLLNVDSGEREPIKMLRRSEFVEKFNATNYGTPNAIYIDRQPSPTMYVLPTIPVGSTANYKILLTGLKMPDDVRPEGGSAQLPFPDAWMNYLALSNAVHIGSGPVVALSPSRIAGLFTLLARAENVLESYNGRENVKRPRHTKPRRF